jgi:putative secretion ATPase (PEP-CTERM system associated)
VYEAFYHLQGKPFQLSADPRFFFSSRGHRRAMAYLMYGVYQGEGFIVITGEIGAGKTMLANTLALKRAAGKWVQANVVSTNLRGDDMVRMVAAAFDLPQDRSKAIVLSRVEKFLLACNRQGKRALLVVDEAQNLPARSIEELRMLSNFVSASKPLLQTFLLGQPELRSTLQNPDMEQLRQRIIASCHLGPMDRADTEAYIVHRLQTVGWRNDPSFSEDAFDGIYQHTGGIPRKINSLCDRLMLMGRLDEKHAFTGKDVAVVIDDMNQDFAAVDLPLER